MKSAHLVSLCGSLHNDNMDIRTLEYKVNECIENRIRSLRGRHINRRKMHILNNDKFLRQLHSKYVLVPADKALNNVIVVCKKYYLEVVLREVNATTTYECVTEEYGDLVDGHSKYIWQPITWWCSLNLNACLCFIAFQSYTKTLMVQGL